MITRKQPEISEERIERFRAELNDYIDQRIEEMGKDCPGVPRQVLRNLVENRAIGCPCRQAQELLRS
jgi:hypothetical protein